MHPDKGYSNFLKVCEEFKGVDFNEADTRAKIIDQIFKNSLGWKESNIKRETSVESGRIDYEFHINSACKLVLEAKRTGAYFNIPEDKKRRFYKIGGILSTIPNLMEAVNQVRNYCDDIGCKYAAVTNGHQFVIFSAISIGKSWRDGTCLVFNSLSDIRDNYSFFWNVLNPDNVSNGSLYKHIDENKENLTFNKLISTVHNPDYRWNRNELYQYIQPIVEITFDELIDEARAEILKQCYIHERTKSTQDELDSYFQDKLPHFSKAYGINDIEESEGDAGCFGDSFSDKIKGEKGYLLVLLGGVGAGKSTFIHRYYKFVLSKVKKLLWFNIDFRSAEPNEEAVDKYIFSKIGEEWTSKYKDQLMPVLEKNGFNITGHYDKDYYINLFFSLRKLGFKVSIIIDNVDQHAINVQESIFLHTAHLADLLKSITLISMRENTFLMSTRLGVFDAYHIPKFHISAPNFLRLIMRRIDYTIHLLQECIIDKIVHPIPHDIKRDLIEYFTIIKSSLGNQNRQSEKLVQFIDNISVGNMREALRMFNNFLVSGNTNIAEMFERKRRFHSYQIAFHQFIKSVLLGERRYYSQDKSNILNMFDFDSSIGQSHLNLFRILDFLYERKNSQSEIGTGYVLIDEAFRAAGDVGINKAIILDAILRLAKFSLVELDNLSKTKIEQANYLRITHAGVFYLKELCNEFVYFDTILTDTPISDESIFDKLVKMINYMKIPDRLKRAELFLEYLKDSEERENNFYPEYTANDFTYKKFIAPIYNEYLLRQPSIHDNYLKALKKGDLEGKY